MSAAHDEVAPTKRAVQRRLRVRPAAVRSVVASIATHPANRGRVLRALGQAARFQLRARLLQRPTLVPFATDSVIESRRDDAGSRRAAYARMPDWPEMSCWRRELHPGDLFIDIGANVGLYSVLAAEAGAQVVAVEPLRRAREQLQRNLDLNGYDAEIVSSAVADRSGVGELVGPDALRARLIAPSGAGEVASVTTLDEILGDRVADGVKIDVEGAERRVLAGAARALGEGRIRLLQLEWNDTAQTNYGESRAAVASLLTRSGYELLRPDRRGVLRAVADPDLGADVFARPVGSACRCPTGAA